MAITLPVQNPAQYSDPSVTRYGEISGLNIVTVRPFEKFTETRNFVPYVLVNELAGNIMKSPNKQTIWYQNRGAFMGFVQAAATVTVAASAPATITVQAGGYTQGGTKSLPANGLIFYNSRTGVEGQVSNVSRSVNNAHTFVLTPVVLGQNISVLAGDELLNRGQKYLGEASTVTQTIIRNIDKYSNYCTEIRKDTTITDLADAERIDFQVNGQYCYTYKQRQDDDLSLLLEREFLIMEATQTNNLPYVEEGTNGVVKQIQGNGVNGTFNTLGVTTTFAQAERALSSMGAPKEYDGLCDNQSYIEFTNSMFSTVNNGAIIYVPEGTRAGIDLSIDFKSLKIYKRKYNITNYGLWDEQAMYASSGLGQRYRFMSFFPQGKTGGVNVDGDGRSTTVTVPRFEIMYQTPFGGNKWHIADTGLFASTPTSTTANRVSTTIGYWGSRVRGAQQYMILQGI
jgi:hypothetical protein